jgi:hypothetical protein
MKFFDVFNVTRNHLKRANAPFTVYSGTYSDSETPIFKLFV